MNQNRMCQTFANRSLQLFIRQIVFLSLKACCRHLQFFIRQFVFLSPNRRFIYLSLKATNIIAWGGARLCERNPRLQPPKNPSLKATNNVSAGIDVRALSTHCSSPSATAMIDTRNVGFRSPSLAAPYAILFVTFGDRNN